MHANRARKHMAAVDNYRQRLSALQGSWDTLSLLSHLSGSGTDMTNTRQAFESLARSLLTQLEAETLRKAVQALKASAQISIDIVIRNLYERTADIGFLCADDELRHFVAESRTAREDAELTEHARHIHARLREYVAKYTVYHNVIVLDADGNVLVQLNEDNPVKQSRDALIKKTLGTTGYVETFRKSDLSPTESQSLIYSARIGEGARAGVLCLCFKFDDEVAGIFGKLSSGNDWTLFTFLDAGGRVIASSDPWQIPIGMRLTAAFDNDGGIIRARGREYLAVSRKTQGYQGYMGPGWVGHALIPLEQAFDREDRDRRQMDDRIVASLSGSDAIFSSELRSIPIQAENIQRELNRTVWNGNVALGARTDAQNNSKSDFAKVLLWEIGNTGIKTKKTFERSIGELHRTVMSSIVGDAQLFSSLAVDILDRNLYERANDCRWWALSRTAVDELAKTEPDRERLTQMLRYINGLYTVYHTIVVFDATQRVVAVSNSTMQSLVGKTLNEEWAARTLQLRDSQSHCVSRFESSRFYDDRHTLIYSAAVRGAGNRVNGGVAVVFDSAPQLLAILQDSLPHTESGAVAPGCIGVLVDADQKVMAATERFHIGEQLNLVSAVAQLETGGKAPIVALDNRYYAVGMSKAAGYREYGGLDASTFVLIPLGNITSSHVATRRARHSERKASGEQVIDIATFYCGDQWLGLLREHVVESVGSGDLRPLPGRPAWYAGCLLYKGDPIPVVDLARLTGQIGRDQANRIGTEVIVMHARGSEQRLGLLVDALGDIPEVAVSDLLPVTDSLFQSSSGVVDRAVRPQDPTDPVLLLVSIERLFVQLRSPEPLPGRVNAK